MLKQVLKSIMLLSVVIVLSGCVTNTVEVVENYPEQTFDSQENEVVAEIKAENYCLFLFGCLPIMSGRAALPNAKQYYMWKNTARDHYMKIMMNWYSQNVLKQKGISDYTSETEYSGAWTLWIVTKKSMTSHAKVVK